MKQLDWLDFSIWDGDIDWPTLKQTLIKKITIFQILDHYGVEYDRVNSQGLTHKARCPLHKQGEERTPSFCISEEENTFHCFGCNAGTNIIDFVRLYNKFDGKMAYAYSLEEIIRISGLKDCDSLTSVPAVPKKKPEETLEYYVMRAGNEMRKFVASKISDPNYPKWCVRSTKLFDKLDYILDTMEDSDWKKAKAYYEKILNMIEKEK